MSVLSICPRCQVRHGPCAICDETNDTTRLCRVCKADPANEGWREGDEHLLADADTEASMRPRLAAQSPPRRVPTRLQREVLTLLAVYEVRVQVRRRVRQPGGKRVWVWREARRPLRFREVAFLAGCSESFCRKTYRAVAG